MKGYIKVPFRQVYCDTFRAWLAETIYCHFVLRLSPQTFESISEQPPC